MLARLGEHLRGGGPGADEIAHRFMGSVGNLNLGLAARCSRFIWPVSHA